MGHRARGADQQQGVSLGSWYESGCLQTAWAVATTKVRCSQAQVQQHLGGGIPMAQPECMGGCKSAALNFIALLHILRQHMHMCQSSLAGIVQGIQLAPCHCHATCHAVEILHERRPPTDQLRRSALCCNSSKCFHPLGPPVCSPQCPSQPQQLFGKGYRGAASGCGLGTSADGSAFVQRWQGGGKNSKSEGEAREAPARRCPGRLCAGRMVPCGHNGQKQRGRGKKTDSAHHRRDPSRSTTATGFSSR